MNPPTEKDASHASAVIAGSPSGELHNNLVTANANAHEQLGAMITRMIEKSSGILHEMGVSEEDKRNVMWRMWAQKLEPEDLDEILKKLQWGLGSDNVWRAAVIEARRRLSLENTKFRDAGGQSPALRTDDQPHSL